MALVDINWSPSRKDLRVFSLLLIVFGAVVGALLRFKYGSAEFAMAILIVTGAVGVIGALAPPLVRPVYVVWMAAALPIGWTVSHLMMASVFYLVVTPIGLMMSLCGRDPMQRRIDRGAKTYWLTKPVNLDIKRYFRQF